ncbi:hypothetical protein GGS24DRAFT_498216 [Hypoxylon argillaceum]|nr:hypothetical protein GGS24DRAFT_498216 [Hypoxylon argillaceum]KAI1147800.1 hypothetical protein F4825DRAFT_471021 [Nemania diffusa]
MRSSSFFTGIALSCVVQGLAINNHVTRDDPSFGIGMMSFSSDNFCGSTKFKHETSSQSPLIKDCQEVIDWLNGNRWYGYEFFGWNKGHLESGYVELGKRGSCVLGVKPLDANDGPPVVTMGDAADVIKMAIPRLKKGDHVEGSGTMECQVTQDNEQVLSWPGGWDKRKFQWQIYYPGTQPLAIPDGP